MISIVAIEPVAGKLTVSSFKCSARPERSVVVNGMVQQEHIKIAVKIIIKKSGLCAEAGKIKSILRSHVLVHGNTMFTNPLAYQQLILHVLCAKLSNTAN